MNFWPFSAEVFLKARIANVLCMPRSHSETGCGQHGGALLRLKAECPQFVPQTVDCEFSAMLIRHLLGSLMSCLRCER
jgi:hypothetical protein